MLALARKVNESIVINDNIEITVLEVKGDQIKLGIDAPKSVPVYRKELYVQIQEANQAAVNTPGAEGSGRHDEREKCLTSNLVRGVNFRKRIADSYYRLGKMFLFNTHGGVRYGYGKYRKCKRKL